MRKIIVCFALAAVAALPVFAGEKSDKNKTACADKAKAECQGKTACCAAKSACSKTPSKQALLSPKAAETVKN